MLGIFSLDMELASDLQVVSLGDSLIHHAYTVPTPSKTVVVGLLWVPNGRAKTLSSYTETPKIFRIKRDSQTKKLKVSEYTDVI